MLRKYRGLIVICLVLLLLILIVRACGKHSADGDASAVDQNTPVSQSVSSEFAEGIAEILALEAQDPADVDAVIKESRRQELLALRDERLKQLESGEISVWSLFEDYVILGDSRGAGFKFIAQLDTDRNLAVYGNTMDSLPESYPEIEAMNPAYIILFFGLNDSLKYNAPDELTSDFISSLNELQAHFPDAKIFVNPIFKVIGEGLDRYDRWSETDIYNEALEKAVAETTCYYVDRSALPLDDVYFKDDGIHFTNDFMELWAKEIIMTIYNVEIGLTDFDQSGNTEQADAPDNTQTDADNSSGATVETPAEESEAA